MRDNLEETKLAAFKRLTPRRRRDLRQLLWTALASGMVGSAIGGVVGWTLDIPILLGAMQGISAGAMIGCGTFFFSSMYPNMKSGRWLRSQTFSQSVATKSVINFLIIIIAIRVGVWIYFPGGQELGEFSWTSPQVIVSMAISAYLIISINFVMEVNRMLGQRVLRNFTTGAYHRPMEEDRIFLFMDVVGSTGIAERIGAIRYHAFLDRFFRDLSDPLLEHKGEIHKYVGDEVIVSWSFERGRSGAPIKCQMDFQDRIEERRRYYETHFGFIPEFRSSLHAGSVVSGELGDIKREIVFLGDTVNTAARMVEKSGELEEEFLASEEALQIIDMPEGATAHDLGDVSFRGRSGSLKLFALRRV